MCFILWGNGRIVVPRLLVCSGIVNDLRQTRGTEGQKLCCFSIYKVQGLIVMLISSGETKLISSTVCNISQLIHLKRHDFFKCFPNDF